MLAEARRTYTALALFGYRVDGVVANRVFPAGGDDWRQGWVAAQRRHLDAIRESFAGLPVLSCRIARREPVGVDALRRVADDLYGSLPGADPASPPRQPAAPALLRVEPDNADFVLRMSLPLAERGAVDAARAGDDLVVSVGPHRRVLTLPSVLRRCDVVGGAFDGTELRVRFRPNPSCGRGSRPGPPAGPRRPRRCR